MRVDEQNFGSFFVGFYDSKSPSDWGNEGQAGGFERTPKKARNSRGGGGVDNLIYEPGR